MENGNDLNLNLYLDTYSPLAHAARYASVNYVSILLKYDAELNGQGPLALTAQHGKPDMVKFRNAYCETSSLETDEQDEQGTALPLVKNRALLTF